MNKFQLKKEYSDGYFALLSAIIISLTLLSVTIVTSTVGFYSRSNTANTNNKIVTHFLAKGCAQLALLSIRSNFNYIPHASGTRTEFDSNSCEIVSIVYGLENTTTHEKVATIVTRANHRSVFTVLETHVSVKNPNFVYDSSASLYFTDITHREILDL